MRLGSPALALAVAGAACVAFAACADDRGSIGDQCLKDQDCVSGVCAGLVCAPGPTYLDGEAPGDDARSEATTPDAVADHVEAAAVDVGSSDAVGSGSPEGAPETGDDVESPDVVEASMSSMEAASDAASSAPDGEAGTADVLDAANDLPLDGSDAGSDAADSSPAASDAANDARLDGAFE